jgi:16S rRNA (uracil1498-N3)-methyltransferase
MKLHRFFTDYDLNKGELVINDKEMIHQIKDVLRKNVGDFYIISDGTKKEAVARIEEIGKDSIRVSLGKVSENTNEPEIESHLFCAVLKKENFEWVVQKATEIGVSSITPIITDRTIKTKLDIGRLKKIAKEAAEQSGRGLVPKIKEIKNIEEALTEAKKLEKVYVFDMRGKKVHLLESTAKRVGCFVGPEGGFTDEELLVFESAKFHIINLGALTLRAETAAIIGTYFVTYPN